MVRILIFGLMVATSVFGQDPPSDSDSEAYKTSYYLVCDSASRAKQAESLLLNDGKKSLSDLSLRELSLLCQIYSETGQYDKQHDAAKAMWNLDPNSVDSGLWMESSLINQIGKSTTPEFVIEFVDEALKSNQGNRRILLILKARCALLRDNLTDFEKKDIAGKLLVEASEVTLSSNIQIRQIPELLPELIIENDRLFNRFFTLEEKDALKRRLTPQKTKLSEEKSK